MCVSVHTICGQRSSLGAFYEEKMEDNTENCTASKQSSWQIFTVILWNSSFKSRVPLHRENAQSVLRGETGILLMTLQRVTFILNSNVSQLCGFILPPTKIPPEWGCSEQSRHKAQRCLSGKESSYMLYSIIKGNVIFFFFFQSNSPKVSVDEWTSCSWCPSSMLHCNSELVLSVEKWVHIVRTGQLSLQQEERAVNGHNTRLIRTWTKMWAVIQRCDIRIIWYVRLHRSCLKDHSRFYFITPTLLQGPLFQFSSEICCLQLVQNAV